MRNLNRRIVRWRKEKSRFQSGLNFFGILNRMITIYMDKTAFIAEFLRTKGAVNLFTRPRRFGKSLNMNMLKTFFETGADASLFEGLNISRETEACERHMGKYPVISLSLKDVEGGTYEAALKMMSGIIKQEARRHQYLFDSNRLTEIDKESGSLLPDLSF